MIDPPTVDQTQRPDQRAFIRDLSSADFSVGQLAGRWRFISCQWPWADIAVSAAERTKSPPEYLLRFTAEGYPQRLTATPWNPDAQQPTTAAERPKGPRVGMVFRTDWESGRALYAPFDWFALHSHQGWRNQHARHAWHERRTLTFYLRNVWELLNEDDYLGIA